MKQKAKVTIAYSGIVLAILYFAVVAGYFLTESTVIFKLWEAMIILSALILLLILISVLENADEDKKSWKIAAIAFMVCTTVITSAAHYSNIISLQGIIADFLPNDPLAWGFFMGLAFIFTSASLSSTFKNIKYTSMICGCLCLIGFLGPILNVIPLWFVAVAGFVLGIPVICVQLLLFYKRQGEAGK